MKLAAHQPNYWPYPGLIGKIMRADKFLFMSNVQLEKRSWQMRNRIRTKDGWDYIRVPVFIKGKYEQRICDTKIDNSTDWKTKSRRTIHLNYVKSPYYQVYKDFLDDLYTRTWNYLNDIDIYIMNYILKELNVTTQIFYDVDYEFKGQKTTLLVDYCKKMNCNMYISNLGSAAYVKISEFNKEKIDHIYINYKPVEYKQQFQGFESGLSILDMLVNCGTELTREILMDDQNFSMSEINMPLQE